MKQIVQTKELLLEQLKKTPIVQIACEKIGIGRATFYRWKADDPAFAKAVDDALLEGKLLVNDLAESQLIGAIKDRNLTAITYWLRHHHQDYKNRLELEGTVNTIHELSDEQKALVKKALELTGLTLQPYEKQQEDGESAAGV
jgi:hypothetical protein